MRRQWCKAVCFSMLAWCSVATAGDPDIQNLLHSLARRELPAILPPDTHLLLEPSSIEQLLDELDGDPPDWRTIYGHGHHDPEHDDRLFALNRARDAKREGKQTLSWLVTFAWSGELSSYREEAGGFPVAIGPRFTSTRWGIVRFKPEEAPSNLVAVVDERQREALQSEITENGHLEILVLMTGRLVPEESLVYDFSHEEEGRGLIMPFVRVEQVQFVRLSS